MLYSSIFAIENAPLAVFQLTALLRYDLLFISATLISRALRNQAGSFNEKSYLS